jgi:hypothetical protein
VGLNGLYIIVVGEINVMIATIGPMFEPDYIDQFRMYMEAKDALTYALCGIDLRSKNRCDGFLFKTALDTVEKAVMEPSILLKAEEGALNLLEEVLAYLKNGEGDYDGLFKQTMELLDELDAENEGVVERMCISGRLRGYV